MISVLTHEGQKARVLPLVTLWQGTLPSYPPPPNTGEGICLEPTNFDSAMRQRILGSHTPPCHRRMVIATLFSVFLAALQRRPVLYHTRWLLTVLWLWSSGH